MKYVICLLVLLCLASVAPACDLAAPVPSVGYSYSTYTSGYGLPVYDPAASYYWQQYLLSQQAYPLYGAYYVPQVTVGFRTPLTIIRNRGATITIVR